MSRSPQSNSAGDPALTLARAFHNYPLNQRWFPQAAVREKGGRLLYQLIWEYGLRYGYTQRTEDAEGVLVALPPSGAFFRLDRELRVGWRKLLRWDGMALARMLRDGAFLETLRRRHCPQAHWYIAALGVAPPSQSQGIARALLADFLDAQVGSATCYLETFLMRNVEWYARRGFALLEQVALPGGGAWAYAMVRPGVGGGEC